MNEWLEAIAMLSRTNPRFEPDATRAQAFRQIGRFLETQTRHGAPYDLAMPSCPIWPTILSRLEHAVQEVQTTELQRDEVRLWQMYNHGVVIKSHEIAMGFDIIAAPRRFEWPDPTAFRAAIAQTLDVLFVTHHHADHFDRTLIPQFLRTGRPVILPEPLAVEYGYDPNMYPMKHGQKLSLYDMEIRAHRGLHVWRSSPDEVPLLVYEVTCQGGYRFVFGGDVDYTAPYGCETIRKRPNVFFVPWRSPNERYEPRDSADVRPLYQALQIALRDMAPRAVIFEHYAELEHVYDGFPASYELALSLQEQLEIPSALLFWGECLSLHPFEAAM